MNNTRKVILGMVFTSIVIGGLLLPSLLDPNPIRDLGVVGKATDFSLPSIDGAKYQLYNETGKIKVLTFIYTKCIWGCSTIVAKMDMVRDMLQEEGRMNSIRFIAIDFDYLYDNMTDLEIYAEIFVNLPQDLVYWQFLLGNEEETLKVTSDYGFAFKYVNETTELGLDHDGSDHVEYLHFFMTYIIDKNNNIRKILYDQTWANDELYYHLDFLLEE
ncbi:MAG: SCO family protein [Candidatus Heimdallarchaeota archaeon]|nr:SCO family protein [Candidatus Heimdallarchaeota archaeon]